MYEFIIVFQKHVESEDKMTGWTLQPVAEVVSAETASEAVEKIEDQYKDVCDIIIRNITQVIK